MQSDVAHKKRSRITGAVLAFFAAAGLLAPGGLPPAHSQGQNPMRSKTMLTEPAELQEKLKESGLRILDTRSKADYAKKHIPGAVWVDVKSWQQLASREGGLGDAKAWTGKIGQLGVGRVTPVVVYGSSLPDTCRVLWMLRY